MNKILWLDLETTGISSEKNGIIELAAMIMINNKITGSFNAEINPKSYNKKIEIKKEALKINGYTKKDFKHFGKSPDQFKYFTEWLDKYVNKYDKTDKFVISGYNSRFDIDFLRAWFEDNDHKYYGSYFSNYDNDVFAFIKKLWASGHISGTENLKLPTICEYFGIELDAHNAIDDIEATIELDKILTRKFLK